MKRLLEREMPDGSGGTIVVTYRPRDLLNRPWSQLRGIGNSTAVKLTILIPAIGYLIIFNDDLREHFQLWRGVFGRADVSAGDAVPLRLLLLYFGLVALAAGSILHQIFCPAEIKRYGSDIDYIADMEAHASKAKKNSLTKRIEEDAVIGPAYRLIEQAHHAAMQLARTVQSGEMDADADRWRDIFALHFHTIDASARVAREATTIFYAMGFTLVGIPSLNVFVHVLRYALRAAIGAIA
jgi:hypothetical protein